MKKFANGTYKVRITDIANGESSIKGTPFVELTFGNEYRYLSERIYTNGNGWRLLSLIFWKAGLDYWRNSLEDLRGRILGIEVVSGNYINSFGAYKTFGKVGTFYCIDELDMVPEDNYAENKVATYVNYYNNYDNEYTDNSNPDEETTLADIFGVDLEDVSRDMRKDISEIDDNDIRKYCGY